MSGNSFYTRKLHSLLGVIPLGLFLIEHALTNYSAFEGGPEKFQKSVHGLHDLPLIFFLELFFIWLPILFHGVYGLYLAFTSNLNTGRFQYGRNWAFALQRITGVLTFIFIIWHLWQIRVQVALGELTTEEFGSKMYDIMHNPAYFVLYLIGVLAATFHFSNGLWAFLVSWGITIGPRAQRISSRICMGIFVIMSVLFILSMFAFRGDEFATVSAVAASTLQLG
ncbi:succinate dehydrogenase cytochrome b558 subunit [Cohnella lubricantis]|uniref:Succinate dehydrogenase cytochrome b558 subunit n=1 Tax=Cohnella lubricantis TaxID=2163172 RepID=A0A841TAJ8_9BACL|nr:succinate dehydrogenase cytochrome b558 subunit [Cohnella lubricantis]MBB6678324.1 succinate dehydrogenase cytochrome b558 subunit [Cohnella lubricantis]MBP2118527.1 succinate dehydrogenase / fumarate reductase cytochrome b subunit [Cohnella lubricantis]